MNRSHEREPVQGSKQSMTDEIEYWGSQSLWGNESLAARPPNGPAALVNPSPELKPIECIVLGPPGAGKTSWIGALGQSMTLPPENHRALRLIPRATGVIVERLGIEDVALGTMMQPESPRHSKPQDSYQSGGLARFDFDIGPISPSGRLRRTTFIECPLTPEGFPPSTNLGSCGLSLSSKAIRCLVISLDGSSNQTLFWHRVLPSLLDRLTSLPENDRERRTPKEHGTAPFDRILFSINKVDEICRLALAIPVQERKRLQAQGLTWATKSDVVKRINPLRYLAQQLGTPGISRILSVARQDSPIAVCTTSARGLIMPQKEEENGTAWKGRESLLSWRPFGLLEALRFVMTGQIEGHLRSIKSHLRQAQSRITSPW